jgi:hypothetical protein
MVQYKTPISHPLIVHGPLPRGVVFGLSNVRGEGSDSHLVEKARADSYLVFRCRPQANIWASRCECVRVLADL